MTQPEPTAAPVLSSNPTYEPAAVVKETKTTDITSIPDIYETDRTIEWILSNDYTRVALQFPDELLPDSTSVEKVLHDGLKKSRKENVEEGIIGLNLDGKPAKERKIYILADTSYGSCCVDEVAADHAAADCIIHYGRACLSPTSRLPVLHIFTTQPLDITAVANSLSTTFPDKSTSVILASTLPYSAHIPTLHTALAQQGYTSIFATEVIHDPSSPIPNRTCPPTSNIESYHIFHISQPLTSLILTLSTLTSATSLQIYHPETNTTEESLSSRILRRRYALLSHIRAAGVYGILINTLSSNNYLSTITTLQALLKKHYKKSYLVTVGKLNPAKVANFAEVEVWIVVGCWESAIVDENRDMWRVVVTPWEVTAALDGGEGTSVHGWRGDWQGFQSKVDEYEAAEKERGVDEEEDDDEESAPPVFDMRTGRYISTTAPMRAARTTITNGDSSARDEGKGKELATTNQEKGMKVLINNQISPAAEYLQQRRGWKGLGSDWNEIEYDNDGNEVWRGDEGAIVEEGRKGVARGYNVNENESRQ